MIAELTDKPWDALRLLLMAICWWILLKVLLDIIVDRMDRGGR